MLLKKFFKFVLPSIVSMWIFALYTMVDGMFVSWGVGESALASVNLSMPYVIMIFTIGLLMATGTSTLISVSLGKKEEEQASRLFTMNLAVLTVLSLAVTAVSLIFLEPIALFLGASPDNITYVKEYVGTISVFAVFFILSYNMEALVKTDGHPDGISHRCNRLRINKCDTGLCICYEIPLGSIWSSLCHRSGPGSVYGYIFYLFCKIPENTAVSEI